MFLKKHFFLSVTIAIITEKKYFSCFHDNDCHGNKYFLCNYAFYQFKLSLKKWSQTDDFSKKIAATFTPLLKTQTLAAGSRCNKKLFYIFTITCPIPESVFDLFKISDF